MTARSHSCRAVLFDLDGTLLDTLQDLGESMNLVLRRRGFPEHPIDAYRYYVGDGATMLVMRSLPEAERNAEQVRACLDEYRKVYAQHWNVNTRPYDGIPELLDALRARGMKLAVLSNKPHEMTRQCVAGYLARWPFAAVLGQREAGARKPDPAGAREAASLCDASPAETLYVGDTATDMETANAAGMYAVGATWGFRPEKELRAHGARAIAHHPRDVQRLLSALRRA